MPKRGSSLSQRGQLCNRYTSMCSENPPSDHFSAKQKLHSSLETAQNCLSTEKPFLAASPPKDSCFSSSSSSCYLSFPGAGRGWRGGGGAENLSNLEGIEMNDNHFITQATGERRKFLLF